MELLKVANGLDLNYGTQKVHSESKNLLIPHHCPITVLVIIAPPFSASIDSVRPRGEVRF